ncbi:hypothetical protein HanPI659440_Chr13g0505961 [Helianthus annuus]|nr:hypothetical protein HanPI659440_Chr13g0505961 [Helianthus annuus]
MSFAFVEPLEQPVSASTIPSSPPKIVDVEAQKKGGENSSIEVVSSEGTPPAVHAEQVSKQTGGDTIFDTLDSSNNLIDLRGDGDKGARSQSPLYLKRYPVLLLQGRELKINLQFSQMSLNWIIIIALILKCLEKEKAAFEKLKQTERWAASASLEQVRSLTKLLSDERKLWKEACAIENEKLLRVRQELNNLKAANAALVKEKTAAEAAIIEGETHGVTTLKEAEAPAAKELADANADRTTLNKFVEELQAELKSRISILEEVTSHATEAETRARQAEEARDGLTTSLAQVTDDHAWMRQHDIRHIVETILDAPENATAVTDMNERARWAGLMI